MSKKSLIDLMRREGHRFDFYQAVRLLEQRQARTPGAGAPARGGREGIRFRPSAALAFPASDVKRIDVPESPHEPPTVVATFMGLYGVDAPLPDFFYERLATDEAGNAALGDFLDIFSNRFYSFFYRAWKRVRPEMDRDAPHAGRFLALAGLAHADGSDSPLSPHALMPFAGRLSPRARSAEGLTHVLRALFDLPAEIVQNVPRWVTVSRPPGIGRGARLAGGTILGDRVFDVSGKFRVRLGPMDLDQYLSLLPGGDGARTLSWVVRAYVPGYLDYDVALQLRTDRLPAARLGDSRCRLGLTACVGKPALPVLSRIVGQS